MRAFTRRGRVVRGARIGRKLGFPTANVAVRKVPPFGVYRVLVVWPGTAPRGAVCHVGVRPTMRPKGKPAVEVHIPGFSGDLYGKRLVVRFIARLRGERRFASLPALKKQIRADIRRALNAGGRSGRI